MQFKKKKLSSKVNSLLINTKLATKGVESATGFPQERPSKHHNKILTPFPLYNLLL